MGYTESKNQTNVPKGKVRYEFYTRVYGDRHRKTVVCPKSAVKNLYQKWEREIYSGKTGNKKLFESLNEYLIHVQKIKSISSYENAVRSITRFKKCFKEMPLNDFRRSHVDEFIYWRKKSRIKGSAPISAGSINRDIAELSIFFSWAIIQDYYIGNNPCFKAKLRTTEREVYLSTAMLEELLDKARDREDPKLYTAILLALLAGLRRNEVTSLEWTDIDWLNSRINLRAQNTKGSKRRVIAMPEFLRAHLYSLYVKEEDLKKIFWEWQTADGLRHQWQRFRENLSFHPLPNGDNLRFHDLRHVYAQSLRDAGVSLADIQAFLGHSSIAVTEKFYAQAGGKNALEKVEKIGKIIPLKKKSG